MKAEQLLYDPYLYPCEYNYMYSFTRPSDIKSKGNPAGYFFN
jgi:hypothetical protein